MQRVEHRTEFQGPIPPPEVLAAYESLHPGASALLFEEFREQGQHRRDLERQVVSGSERRAGIGQWIGAIIVSSGIVGGVVLGIAASPPAGATVVAAAMGSAALVYIVGGRPPSSGD